MKFLACALVFLSFSAVALASPPIFGGDLVVKGSPIDRVTVGLLVTVSDGRVGTCSGVLIGSDLVLTAAHCLLADAVSISVCFGGSTKEPTETIAAKKWAANPNWKGEIREKDQSDLGLIILQKNAPEGYESAVAQNEAPTFVAGDQVKLAGFGISKEKFAGEPDNGSGVLRETTVKIENPSFGASEFVVDQSTGSGACYGDSGGPAFLVRGEQVYLLGISSREVVPLEGECPKQAIYQNVFAFQSWIESEAPTLRNQ